MVAFGLGGVFVEVLRRVSGRLAPFTEADAEEMIAEFDDLGVADGFRGGPPWDRPLLAGLLVAAGELAAGARHWLRTFDVNPLIQTDTGFVAVDGACFVEPGTPATAGGRSEAAANGREETRADH